MLGKQIGPYRILAKIGQGGMGIVYKGLHTHLEQEVAIKVLSPEHSQEPSMRERFQQEARIQAKLRHPNVVNIFNYLEDDEDVFLVMEYITGESLDKRLARRGSIPEPEAVSICQSVLAALSFMHARGVVHRDIKPGNILFTDDGLVKVTDFGIAKVTGEDGHTKTGMRIGTLWYMSPEQVQGKPASMASDVYALGITLYEMVTGQLPFQGTSEYTLMKAHIEQTPAPPWTVNDRVSQALGHMILQALEKQPEHRYQTAQAFTMALTGLTHQPSTPTVGPLASAPATALPRHSWQSNTWQYVTLCAGIGSIFGIILYAVYFYPQRVDIPAGAVLAPAQRLTPPTATAHPESPARSPQSSLSPAVPPAAIGPPESPTFSTPMLSVQPQEFRIKELPEPLINGREAPSQTESRSRISSPSPQPSRESLAFPKEADSMSAEVPDMSPTQLSGPVPSHLPMPPLLIDDNKNLSQDGPSHDLRETTPPAPTSQASTGAADSSQADSTPPPKPVRPHSKSPLPKSGRNSRGWAIDK